MARIKSELAKLQKLSGTESADDAVLRVLVDITARRDALFYPWRSGDWERCKHYPAILDLQRGYRRRQIGISAKASGQRDWKAAHSLRTKLLELGYATATRSRGQVTGLFVTEKGDGIVHAIVEGSEPPSYQTAVIYEYLSRRRILSESKLFQRELQGNPDDWQDLTQTTLPLLVRGMVAATFDTANRVFYRWRLSDFPEIEPSTEPIRDWAFDHYWACYTSERSRLETLKYDGHEVYVPIPASGAGNCLISDDTAREYAPGELRSELQAAKSKGQ